LRAPPKWPTLLTSTSTAVEGIARRGHERVGNSLGAHVGDHAEPLDRRHR
jgi:hypothetical protein